MLLNSSLFYSLTRMPKSLEFIFTCGNVTSVFFAEFGGVDQSGAFIVTKIHIIPEDVDVEKFPYVLLLLIPAQSLLIGELIPDFG